MEKKEKAGKSPPNAASAEQIVSIVVDADKIRSTQIDYDRSTL